MDLIVIARSTSSRTGMVPPRPISFRVMPCRPRKNANVTTNDGIPSLATSNPITRPTTAPTASPMSTATGQLWPLRSMATAVKPAAMPPVTPADRSISPSRSTGTRPMASTEMADA